MADSGDAPDEGSDYISERQRIAERFIALGGGRTIEMDLARMPKLADLVTDQHRAMVKDLSASGLSNEAVARIMGISKERLQTLFEYELGTGYELAHATLARALFMKGAAGETQAATAWVRFHNRSQWADKKELTDKGAAQADAEVDKIKEAGQDLLTSVLSAMSTDKQLFKRPGKDKVQPIKAVQSVKPKPTKAGATLKKPKGD